MIRAKTFISNKILERREELGVLVNGGFTMANILYPEEVELLAMAKGHDDDDDWDDDEDDVDEEDEY